jgi:hypothetical protein
MSKLILILICLITLTNTFELRDLLEQYNLDINYTFGSGDQYIKLYKTNSFQEFSTKDGISLNILYTIGTDPTFRGKLIGSVSISLSIDLHPTL